MPPAKLHTLEKIIPLLGFAGLIPFVLLAALTWVPDAEWARRMAVALTAYAATIASFLGGIHWGVGLLRPEDQRRLHIFWGVTPSLLAWIALMLPVQAALSMLALLLLACYAVDRKTYPAAGLAHWLGMRLQLTTVASLSCLAGAVAIAVAHT